MAWERASVGDGHVFVCVGIVPASRVGMVVFHWLGPVAVCGRLDA